MQAGLLCLISYKIRRKAKKLEKKQKREERAHFMPIVNQSRILCSSNAG